MTPAPISIHASCVAIGPRAVLLMGESGVGKSDLALRLLDRGAHLVSDDYTMLAVRDATLFASAPATIAGMIEVRGIGLVPMPHIDNVMVGGVVMLGAQAQRLPDKALTTQIAGVELACMNLAHPMAASAPVRVELFLRHVAQANVAS